VIGDAQIGVYQTSRQTVSAPIGKQRGICIACICANDKEGRKAGGLMTFGVGVGKREDFQSDMEIPVPKSMRCPAWLVD
jgi:hypothetical protein